VADLEAGEQAGSLRGASRDNRFTPAHKVSGADTKIEPVSLATNETIDNNSLTSGAIA
jgi:hypothetical protein